MFAAEIQERRGAGMRPRQEALHILHDGTPPKILVLLSDINIPGMSGVELLEEVRKSWPELNVFMITAYGDAATGSRVGELGVSRFFTKPVDFSQLKSDMAHAIGSAT